MDSSLEPTPTPTVINVVLDEPEQLFDRIGSNSVRQLDERVERLIIHRAEELQAADYKLVVETRSTGLSATELEMLADGVRDCFAHRNWEEVTKLQLLIADGKRDMIIGFIFLFICGALGFVIARLLPGNLAILAQEGLIIIGWVALWRPVDLFLYELRPLRRRRDLLHHFSRIDVSFAESKADAAKLIRPG